jgi:hypothetical protein
MNRRTGALVLVAIAVAGCTLKNSELRKETVFRIGGSGQVIEPKRCGLQIAIVTRPLRDDVVKEVVWRMADEQAIAPSAHHAWEVNGLRIGRITGDLPVEIEAMLKASPQGQPEVPRQSIERGDGEPALISLSESTPHASLLLNRNDRTIGKDYTDISGWLRVTPEQEGAVGVRLRFVPEIHHGPIQRAFGALPSSGTLAPQEFVQKDGQQEETFRELAASLTLQPGQVAVIGCRVEGARSLGSFLLTQPEANSDRLTQRLILIWASRTNLGTPSGKPTVPSGLEPVEPPDMPLEGKKGR